MMDMEIRRKRECYFEGATSETEQGFREREGS